MKSASDLDSNFIWSVRWLVCIILGYEGSGGYLLGTSADSGYCARGHVRCFARAPFSVFRWSYYARLVEVVAAFYREVKKKGNDTGYRECR